MILYLSFLLILPAFNLSDPLITICRENYIASSTFESSFILLLYSLSSSNANFTTDIKGLICDRAYGLFLDHGDVIPSDCHACIQNSVQDVRSLCPISKQAIIWYDDCELLYADQNFFAIVNETNNKRVINANNATDMKVFTAIEMDLLDKVTCYVAYNSSLKFATRVSLSNGSTMYALSQCTRDVSINSLMLDKRLDDLQI